MERCAIVLVHGDLDILLSLDGTWEKEQQSAQCPGNNGRRLAAGRESVRFQTLCDWGR